MRIIESESWLINGNADKIIKKNKGEVNNDLRI